MSDFDRDTIVDVLKSNVVMVSFTKANGEQRDMSCTLMPSKLPAIDLKEDKKPRKENLDVIRVFDLEKQAWRSFRVDSIRTYRLNN
jgi:hypothetical protein